MAQQTRRSYTDDFKAQAVTLAESIGRGEAARQLDISVKTLGNWLDAARNGRPLSSPARHPVSDLKASWLGFELKMPRSKWSEKS